jgi:hypothetical protein
VHFTLGLVQIAIIVMQKIIFLDIYAIVVGMKNQATQTWFCHTLVENIANKKDMKLVLILDVIFYVIQEVVLLAQ